MAVQVVRFSNTVGTGWGVHRDGRLFPLTGSFRTTREFLEGGGIAEARSLSASATAASLPLAEVRLLSPVTEDGSFICQATNYAGHLHEIGRRRADLLGNVFFTKASSCLCGPEDDVICPSHVRLLDYEIELGLVVGRTIDGPLEVTEAGLSDVLAGLVVTNDITARDVQISHEQFHKSKSYRTFGPTGPFLVLPDPQEWRRWRDLKLELRVNGQLRQSAFAADMIFGPGETLTELSQIRTLHAGDLIATGTPAGVALKVPSKLKIALAGFLPSGKRFSAFLRSQSGVAAYLRHGDVIEASIRDSRGTLDLGTQRNRVAGPAAETHPASTQSWSQ